MRILINALQAGNLSGTGRYTTELLRALLAQDEEHDVHIFWPEHLKPTVQDTRLHIHRRKSDNAANRLLTDQIGLRDFLRRHAMDIIHYPANIGPVTRKHKLVLTVHDLSFIHNPQWFRPDRAMYYRVAAQASARTARRIIADSKHTAADLQKYFKIPNDKIDVAYLGVEPMFKPAPPEVCAAVRRKYALPEKFFLYVGTMEPRKNLPRVIQAWSSIAKETDWDLVVAGRRGWKTKAVDDAAYASPLSARIHFPGFIDHADLPALLSAAQAFVWPSLYEGFGLPPLEAMACGVPVLTSNTSSLPEVVGDAALTVSPESVEEIAESMRKLSKDDTLRAELQKQGLVRAKKFTWEKTAKSVLKSYQKAMDE